VHSKIFQSKQKQKQVCTSHFWNCDHLWHVWPEFDEICFARLFFRLTQTIFEKLPIYLMNTDYFQAGLQHARARYCTGAQIRMRDCLITTTSNPAWFDRVNQAKRVMDSFLKLLKQSSSWHNVKSTWRTSFITQWGVISFRECCECVGVSVFVCIFETLCAWVCMCARVLCVALDGVTLVLLENNSLLLRQAFDQKSGENWSSLKTALNTI